MKTLKLMLVLIVCLLFTGCWDKKELEDRSFVMTFGFDRDAVTLAFPNFSEEEKDKLVKTAKAESISKAVKIIDGELAQDVDFSQAKACVLGKELLKDKDKFKEVLEYLEQNSDVNQKLVMLATDNESEEILRAKTKSSDMVGSFAAEFFNNNVKNLSYTVEKDFKDIKNELLSTGNTLIPKIYIQDDEVKIGGAAIISDYELKEMLDDNEVRGYLWLTKNELSGELTEDTFSVMAEKIMFEGSFSEGENGLVYNVYVKVECVPLYIVEDKESVKLLFKEKIEREARDMFTFFRDELKTDGLGLMERLKKTDYDLYLKYSKDIKKAFEETELNFNVDIIFN